MTKKLSFCAIFLLFYAFSGFSQGICDLILIPEGNNLCLRGKGDSDFFEVRACRGNIMSYRAYAPSSIGLLWNVEGGAYYLNDDSTRCFVTWGEGSGGTVSVTAMLPDSSTCTKDLQIVLEDKPAAGILSIPNYIVDINNPDKKWLEVCAGDTLSFVDNSTCDGRPIVGYYWEYPGGTSNSQSISFVAQSIGAHTIIHRVYNECGCYDEVSLDLTVREPCPLEVSCFGTTCAFSRQSYSIRSPNCTDYLWYVEGGTLVGSQHAPDVEVQWGNPESGYGILYFDGSSCDCGCRSRKSIKVPIISNNVSITGADTLCRGASYDFSVPLWGATSYSWSVFPSTGILLSPDSNILSFTPQASGTYTIQVSYSCDFLGCGPYLATKRIVVREPLSINAPSADGVCIGSVLSFGTTAHTPSLWTVSWNDSIIHTATAQSLSYSFDTSGLFVIRASNDGCCNEASVTFDIKDNPPAPTLISGPDSICPYYTATYSATPSSPAYYLLWEWCGNETSHTCSGNTANITFGYPVQDFNVYQVRRGTECRSEATTVHVSPFQPAPWPYNDTIRICPGQQITLSRLYDQSDNDVLYEWEVYPSNALSIQGSHLEASVVLLANHITHLPTTVDLILKRKFCDTELINIVPVLVGEIGIPSITHAPVCAGQSIAFSTTDRDDADASASYWYIDDDADSRIYGSSADLVFDDEAPHVVHLHYVSRFGCETDAHVSVTPCQFFPYFTIVENGDSLMVVADGQTAGFSYLWSTGDTTASISTPSFGCGCDVTSLECGCTRSLWHHIATPPSRGCNYVDNAFGIIYRCKNIISIGRHCGSEWHYPVSARLSQGARTYTHTISGEDQRIMVPDTGAFFVTLTWRHNDSCYTCTKYGTVDDAFSFRTYNDCMGHLVAVVGQTDSTPVPFSATVSGRDDGVAIGTASGVGQVSVAIPHAGWYSVLMTFNDEADCYFSTIVHFDATPSIQRIHVQNDLCEKTPFSFFADATGDSLTYRWGFGEGSWNFGNGIFHAYDDNTPRLFASLTVTDRNHCSATDSVQVNVVGNVLDRYTIIDNGQPDCPGDSVVIQTNGGDNLYRWSPCHQFSDNTANVYAAGTYIVDITSIHGLCRKQLARNVAYPNTPFAKILCDSVFCQNDVAELVGDAGSEYSYHWNIQSENRSEDVYTSSVSYHLVDTGQYKVVLWVTDARGCSAYDVALFYVHPAPPTPSLEFCGNKCITQGPVKLCSADDRELLWSNGSRGPSSAFLTDGLVGAYYHDPKTGCRSENATIMIPEVPNFNGLLSGCYCISGNDIPTDLPLYSLGARTILPWEWYLDDEMLSENTLPPSPGMLNIIGEGEYRLAVLDYGLGCKAYSPLLSIQTRNCPYPISPSEKPSVRGYVEKKTCRQEDCSLLFDIQVSICNETDSSVCIDNISTPFPIAYAFSTVLPFVLDTGECRNVSLSIEYDFTTPAFIPFVIYSRGRSLGNFLVSLADWRSCVNPDTCDIDITVSLALDHSLSRPNQSAFFGFSLALPSGTGNVISAWCDQGQIIDGNNLGSSFSGLLMLDYGDLTQQAAVNADFCFHLICCENERICVSDTCIPYRDFWEYCSVLPQQDGMEKMMHDTDGADDRMTEEKLFMLVPSPATAWVKVVSRKRSSDDAVRRIEVFSLNGQRMLEQKDSDLFDVSSLAAGTYIVKVMTKGNRYEYLKLIKH
ncbi:MAG: T9SS type A sorting domain-containing protein [Bacteroidales bacterium]|nr:T9SS type A sorting domain-containing protein [Bacteroidales bacterium]